MKKIIIIAAMIASVLPSMAQQNFKLPKYTTFKLSNGLTVYLMEQKEVPVISVTMTVPAATIYDGTQAGLSQLTASSLDAGSKNFSKEQIREQLDFAGANLYTNSNQEFTRVSAKFATATQDKIFALLKDVVVNPLFDNAEFEKLKTRTKASLERDRQSPQSVMPEFWNSLMFPSHVYSIPPDGLLSTVSGITAEDAKKFHAKYYRPNGSVIAVVGNFNSAEMKTRITKLFGDWKKGEGSLTDPAAQAVTPVSKARVLLVDKADARETTFYIGGKGITKKNEDRVAIEVVNTVFGDRFTSWLNDELRVNSGLTYGARSRFDSKKYGGTFFISSFTASKTTFQAIDKALEVFDKLQKGIDDTTLQSARNYVIGQFPPDFETSGQLANLLNDMFVYGYSDSYINDFEKNVKAVDKTKALEIIKNYFSKEKLQFLLIGKADEIREGAKKYGDVSEKSIKDDSFELKKAF